MVRILGGSPGFEPQLRRLSAGPWMGDVIMRVLVHLGSREETPGAGDVVCTGSHACIPSSKKCSAERLTSGPRPRYEGRGDGARGTRLLVVAEAPEVISK